MAGQIAFLKAPTGDRDSFPAKQTQSLEVGELALVADGLGQQRFGGLRQPGGFRVQRRPVDHVGAVCRDIASDEFGGVGVAVEVEPHNGLPQKMGKVEHRRGLRCGRVAFKRNRNPVQDPERNRPQGFKKRPVHAEVLKLAGIGHP